MAAIIGIGELRPVRSTTGATTLSMIADVARLALADAGLEPGAIDGLLVGPQVGETPQHVPATVAEYLGLRPDMANVVDLGGASGAGMVWRAAAAIEAGMCETVLCVLANTREAEPPRSPNRNPIREFDVPFGASGANATYAMIKQRHMAEYGSLDTDFALIAAAARDNAQRNPEAIFFGQPAGVAEVLASPLIASPLHLFEIVMPVAGGAAVIVASAAAAKRATQPPVHLLGAGEKVTHRALSQAPSLTSGPLKPAIARALGRAGVGIGEIDVLSLYDCYSIMVATTLEDAGLAPPGQFGNWLRDADLRRLNPHGGQLGFGQPDLAGGMTHIVEAVRQLRGTTPMRQIDKARLALITGNGATMSEATALVLGGGV
ncbi:thiolase family protein [Devosia sp.]|uniref:thiolase family protein n=1 Tax=Devosia sp. TaxID=1871048 RepID=UPI003F724AC5